MQKVFLRFRRSACAIEIFKCILYRMHGERKNTARMERNVVARGRNENCKKDRKR